MPTVPMSAFGGKLTWPEPIGNDAMTHSGHGNDIRFANEDPVTCPAYYCLKVLFAAKLRLYG
jgi:hypothetical protein